MQKYLSFNAIFYFHNKIKLSLKKQWVTESSLIQKSGNKVICDWKEIQIMSPK